MASCCRLCGHHANPCCHNLAHKSHVVVERRGNPGAAEPRGNPGAAERRGNRGVAERRGNRGAAEHLDNRGVAAYPPAAVALVAAFPTLAGGLLSVPRLQHPAAGEQILVRPHLPAEARIAAQLYLPDVARILAREPALVRLRQGFAQSAASGRTWARPPDQDPVTAAAGSGNPVAQQPY